MGIGDFLGLDHSDQSMGRNKKAERAANAGEAQARGIYDQGKGEANSIYDQGLAAYDQGLASYDQGVGELDKLSQAGQPATNLYNELVGGGETADAAFRNSLDYKNMIDATAAGAEDIARFGAGAGNLFSGNTLIDLADNQYKHRQGSLNDLYSHLNPGMEMFTQGQTGKGSLLAQKGNLYGQKGNLYGQKAQVPMDWARLTGQSYINTGQNTANRFMADNAAQTAADRIDAGLWGGIFNAAAGIGGKAIGKRG